MKISRRVRSRESEHENATNSDGSFSDDAASPPAPGGSARRQATATALQGQKIHRRRPPGCAPRNLQTVYRGPLGYSTCLTAAAVQERAAAMFVVGAAALSASSLPSPSKATTRASTRRRKDFEPRSRCRCVAHLHPTYHPGGGIADPVCTTARLPLAVLSPICCTPHPFIYHSSRRGPKNLKQPFHAAPRAAAYLS